MGAPVESDDEEEEDDSANASIVVEIAHEALLRQWPLLAAWLDADRDALKMLGGVRRAALEFDRQLRSTASRDEWLVHSGERLAAARALTRRADFRATLGSKGLVYLDACIEREDRIHREEQARAEADRLAQARELEQAVALADMQRQRADELVRGRKRQRLFTGIVAVGLVLTLAVALYGFRQRDRAERERRVAASGELAMNAIASLDDDPERGLLLAIEAASLHQGASAEGNAVIEDALHRAINASYARLRMRGPVSISRVACSADGRVFAAAHARGVSLFDSVSGRMLDVRFAIDQRVVGLAFTPDGKRIVAATLDHEVSVWDVRSGERLGTMKGHQDVAWTVAISPDGRRLASASRDSTVRLWDLDSYEPLMTLRGHTGKAMAVAFTSDGARLVSGGLDGKLIVWDASSGTRIREIAAGTSINSIAISPDDSLVTAADFAENDVKVWYLASGTEAFRLKGNPSSIFAVAFSPGGDRIGAGGLDKTVRIWSVSTHEQLRVLRGHQRGVISMTFEPDGRRVVSGGEDGELVAWDLEGDPEDGGSRPHFKHVTQIAYSADGRTLDSVSEDGTAQMLDLKTRESRTLYDSGETSIDALALSPDDRQVAIGGADRTVRIFDRQSNRLLSELHAADKVRALAFSRDGLRLASGTSGGTVRMWDARSWKELPPLDPGIGRINALDWNADGSQLAIAAGEAGVAGPVTVGWPASGPCRSDDGCASSKATISKSVKSTSDPTASSSRPPARHHRTWPRSSMGGRVSSSRPSRVIRLH